MKAAGLASFRWRDDQELHRDVALKRIKQQNSDDPESRRRFLLEAETTGNLEHPGIVPVYGLGFDRDGSPFYAMRFIQGKQPQGRDQAVPRSKRPTRPQFERTNARAAQVTPANSRRLQYRVVCAQPRSRAPRLEAQQHHARPVRGNARSGLGPGEDRRAWQEAGLRVTILLGHRLRLIPTGRSPARCWARSST